MLEYNTELSKKQDIRAFRQLSHRLRPPRPFLYPPVYRTDHHRYTCPGQLYPARLSPPAILCRPFNSMYCNFCPFFIFYSTFSLSNASVRAHPHADTVLLICSSASPHGAKPYDSPAARLNPLRCVPVRKARPQALAQHLMRASIRPAPKPGSVHYE